MFSNKNEDEKIFTPKEGKTLCSGLESYAHGDKIPPEFLQRYYKDSDETGIKAFNDRNLTEWKPQAKTLKKGMAVTVEDKRLIDGSTLKGKKYVAGELIDHEHVRYIKPQFMEDYVEPQEEEEEEEQETADV